MIQHLTGTGGPALKPTYSRRVHVSAEPAGWLRGREAMDKLVGWTGLVLGYVLQVDGLLQEDLPLDTSPVVSLHRIDHLDTNTHTQYTTCNWNTQLGWAHTSFMNNSGIFEKRQSGFGSHRGKLNTLLRVKNNPVLVSDAGDHSGITRP